MLECPLCGGQSELQLGAQPAYRQGSFYRIHRCLRCGVGFAEPRRPDHEIYEQIYRQVSRVPGYKRYQRYARIVGRSRTPLTDLARAEDVYWGVDQALRKRDRGQKVLEIGSGLGYLTAALVRSGYDARGLDISQVAVDAATKRFGPHFMHSDLYEFANTNSGTYDAVVACELIEHLVDPVRFLQAAVSLLAPSGQLIVTTPNRSVFEPGVAWDTEPPPVHFWWFGERSIELLARRLGAEVEFIDYTRYQNVSPLYVWQQMATNTVTREPPLDAAGRVQSGIVRELCRSIADAFPLIRTSDRIQRFRGRRRVTGPRRTVMCAVFRKSVSR